MNKVYGYVECEIARYVIMLQVCCLVLCEIARVENRRKCASCFVCMLPVGRSSTPTHTQQYRQSTHGTCHILAQCSHGALWCSVACWMYWQPCWVECCSMECAASAVTNWERLTSCCLCCDAGRNGGPGNVIHTRLRQHMPSCSISVDEHATCQYYISICLGACNVVDKMGGSHTYVDVLVTIA